MSLQSSEQLQEQFQKDLAGAQRRITELDNDRQRNSLKVVELDQELKREVARNKHLDSEFALILAKYNQVQAETKTLEDDLERAQHQTNKSLHAATQIQKQADTTQMEIRSKMNGEIGILFDIEDSNNNNVHNYIIIITIITS